MKYTITCSKPHTIHIARENSFSEHYQIEADGIKYHVQIKEFHPNGRIKTLIIDNKVYPVEILKHPDGFPRTVYLNGLPFDVEIEKIKSLNTVVDTPEKVICGDIKASLPGQVLSILVKIGDSVKKEQPVAVLESMKMENEVLAPKSGKIKAVLVGIGQVVMKDQLLLQIG